MFLQCVPHGCGCGLFGDKTLRCTCTPAVMQRSMANISGPLLELKPSKRSFRREHSRHLKHGLSRRSHRGNVTGREGPGGEKNRLDQHGHRRDEHPGEIQHDQERAGEDEMLQDRCQ